MFIYRHGSLLPLLSVSTIQRICLLQQITFTLHWPPMAGTYWAEEGGHALDVHGPLNGSKPSACSIVYCFCWLGRKPTDDISEKRLDPEALGCFLHLGAVSSRDECRTGCRYTSTCVGEGDFLAETETGLEDSLIAEGNNIWQEDLEKKLYLSLKENLIFLVYSWNIHSIDMSLILTVLDKLSYFLSLIAFCISVSYSWLKWKQLHLAMHKEWEGDSLV